ncbi:hypothetical protein PoB_002046800 [Plakobranchus ocellatus]|uniref:Uncharacterized protein n=1 Tax=Plakobranchus ocellatus TaxID=259542 RepID=A0AAV3ZGP7_9GAST|nr:hypothetical protein PoB_002046800 [Plakobranchus ocellatus]
MATSNDLLIKQRSVIEILAAEGCSAANIHARMKTVESSFISTVSCLGTQRAETFRRTSLSCQNLDNRALFDEKVIGRRHCLRNMATPSRVARHCIMSTNYGTQTCCSS